MKTDVYYEVYSKLCWTDLVYLVPLSMIAISFYLTVENSVMFVFLTIFFIGDFFSLMELEVERMNSNDEVINAIIDADHLLRKIKE